MKIQSKNGFRDENGKKFDTATLVMELDGYHAPLTAGNIADLVQRKFYDGMYVLKINFFT
jgi:cyclophilin family peptidyl-prolyl cis-trans isomerase